MKTKYLIITFLICGFAVGCAQIKHALTNENVIQRPVLREVVTNVMGNLFTNQVETVEYVTNYVAKPSVETAIGLTEAIPGWGGLASTVLAGALGVYVNSLNKKRAAALASALVTATEAGRDVLKSIPDGDRIDKLFLDAMIKAQLTKGQADPITKLVKELTK